ncbi:MAG: hypothetical protein KGJ57_18270 [Sphingomonadales bacterium]|nr:hypothetical protein [Sphingomonadales bacterium]MDE2171345.1 hypothetical protein [Sphingomonadales bacterium]
MSAPGKKTHALGKDAQGRPVVLLDEGGAMTMRRLPVDPRDTEVRIELTSEIVAALEHILVTR